MRYLLFKPGQEPTWSQDSFPLLSEPIERVESVLAVFLLLLGLAIILTGAEFLVRGAASLSRQMGIPPLVIGLTVVAFGTSAPELVVNLFSAIHHTTDLALGNVLGSNIANILLILGLSAIVRELRIEKSTTRKEIPFAALSLMVLWAMANDRLLDGESRDVITRTDSLTLIGFFAIFMYYTLTLKKTTAEDTSNDLPLVHGMFLPVVLTILGLVGLFFGGRLLVQQAIGLARILGISEMLIGLTIVAVGTSLPELATSVVASYRGQVEIAVGNVVGSNIFNIFWILGATGVVSPLPVSSQANVDITICLGVTLLLLLFILLGKTHRLQRREGVIMVTLYLCYMAYLIERG